MFRAAERQNAVLFFDEADAIAGRRFTSLSAAYEREANAIVNVLLHELESFDGVVIFATNLAANMDPAFERRIRTHILFDMPNAEERERIWRVQLHARKTPLADDVDFKALAERYPAERRATSRTPCSRPPRSPPPSRGPTRRSESTSGTSCRAWRRCWRRRE